MVSVLMPVLNTRRFLPDRMTSILSQSLDDWELRVLDSHSQDGSWEYLQQFRGEKRIHLAQGPRGLYQSWNTLINGARGEYIYIATSDDTMDSGCLSALVELLDAHPEVDLASCALEFIDEQGKVLPGRWRRTRQAHLYEDWWDLAHRRTGLTDFCCSVALRGVPYISVTALLVRKRLFLKSGLFPTHLGMVGDMAWGWSAMLHSDIVYTPRALATWRVSEQQATSQVAPRAAFLSQLENSIAYVFSTQSQELSRKLSCDPEVFRMHFIEPSYLASRELIRGKGRQKWRKVWDRIKLERKYPFSFVNEIRDWLLGWDDHTAHYRLAKARKLVESLNLPKPQPLR